MAKPDHAKHTKTGKKFSQETELDQQQNQANVDIASSPDPSALPEPTFSLEPTTTDANSLASGGSTPDQGTITVAVGTTASEFNAMLDAAGDGASFVLASGTHIFDETITITHDSVTITSDLVDPAIVMFGFPDGTGGNGFEVAGSKPTYAGALRADASAGDTQITLQSSHQVQAGEVIYLFQPNTQEYLDENGWDNVSMTDAKSRPFREFLVEVESVDGAVITLKDPLPFDFATRETRCFEQEMVSDFSMSNLTITFDLGATDPYDFSNSYPEYTQTYGLLLNGTANADLNNLTFVDVASTALGLSNTIHASVDTISIDGSHNLGGGGNGYGVLLHEAFNNDLSNLTIDGMRHSFILSAWNAETGNNVHILSTDRDINFHGGADNGNTIIVDSVTLDYDTDGGYIGPLVGYAASNHPATEMADNYLGFHHAIGLKYKDVFWGTESGDYLDGGGGADTIDARAGNDVIIGNTGNDILTGGGGADLFVFATGSGHDVITDFSISAGDRLNLTAYNIADYQTLLMDASDTSDGVMLSLDNASILLNGLAINDLDADGFIL